METNENINSGLSNQPFETIDHICYFLIRPRDVLAFALTSKQVYRVAVPDHLDFRHLRCDFRRIEVWRRLAARPALTARIATLEIIPEGDDDDPEEMFFNWWPMYIGDANPDDSENDGLDGCEGNVKEELKRNPGKILLVIRICMREFAAALRCMTGLTCFHWLLNQIAPGTEIQDALLKCPSIEDVETVATFGWYPGILLDKGQSIYGVRLFHYQTDA